MWVARVSLLGRLAALVSALALAAPAAAQLPAKGTVAAGAGVGIGIPFEGDYQIGLTAHAAVDYYLSGRAGARVTAGYLRQDTDLPGSPTVSTAVFLVSGLYRWELGDVHLVAQGGAGFYLVEPAGSERVGRAGLHAGGGADYFLDRRTAVTGQLLVHVLKDAGGRGASFLSASAGLRYFF